MALDTSKPVLQTIGRYELFEKIAEGGMGTVYKATDKSNGQVVAIKVVPPQVAKNPVLMKRFEQEYTVSSTLDHPNIVRALDYGSNGSSYYLVMEYVNGASLGQRIEREGKIPEREAITIIAQIAQALHKAHKQGLIHRDVKPDNVLVTADGVAKLADLGLVKELDTDLNLTRTGRGLGTPHFMAPEQFRNAKNADARADIYSLGATLYMMLTGELPFQSNGPLEAWMKKINNDLVPARELVPDLSERVDWALRRAMSVDKDHRPSNCREFIEDLTGHSTRKITPSADTQKQDVWYLVYTDEENVTRTVKGTLQGIRRSLKEGVLGDASNIRASRSKSGPFEVLRNHPEFRDLVLTVEVTPAIGTPTPPSSKMLLPAAKPALKPGSGQLRSGATPLVQPVPPLPSSAKSGPQPKVAALLPPKPEAVDLGPLINLGPIQPNYEWAMWAMLLISTVGLAAVGYFLLPVLLK